MPFGIGSEAYSSSMASSRATPVGEKFPTLAMKVVDENACGLINRADNNLGQPTLPDKLL
ncbi:hypothetical protein GCM10027089_41340 [Nocardia thraciensis]